MRKNNTGGGKNRKPASKPFIKPASKPGNPRVNTFAPTKETYPHFRRYLKSGHPALITDEHSVAEYKYRKVMHDDRDGKSGPLNEPVIPNPNPLDKRPMYIVKRVRHDKKKYFSKNKLPWKYPKKPDK